MSNLSLRIVLLFLDFIRKEEEEYYKKNMYLLVLKSHRELFILKKLKFSYAMEIIINKQAQ